MMPAETARDTIAALGEVGQLQFKDLSEDKSPLQRTFANQVCFFLCRESNGRTSFRGCPMSEVQKGVFRMRIARFSQMKYWKEVEVKNR